MSSNTDTQLPTVTENQLPTMSVAPGEETIQLTEHAIKKTQDFLANNKEVAGKALRIYIEGGGCSGFSYRFKLDDQREGDLVFDEQGVTVLVDPMSMKYIKGSLVDYVEDFTRSGFELKNPMATSTCGCGESFSVS